MSELNERTTVMIPHVDGKNFQNQIFDRSEIFSRIFPDLIENLKKKS
jgi:hypothetical protein